MPVRPIGILGAGRQAAVTSGYREDLGLTAVFNLQREPPLYERDRSDYAAPIYRLDQIHELDLRAAVVNVVGSPRLRTGTAKAWAARSSGHARVRTRLGGTRPRHRPWGGALTDPSGPPLR
jgi:hypothetical protein